MLVFLRSYLVEGDPRLQRYRRALRAAGVPFRSLSWDRHATEPDTAEVRYFSRAAPVGRGFANAVNLLYWNFFCLRELFAWRRQISVVHAVDLDTGVAAALFSLISGTPFIYDAFDQYSASRATRPFVTRCLDALERWVARRAQRVILPDVCRLEQHGLAALQTVEIIENVPVDMGVMREALPAERPSPLVLAYAGALGAKHRGLEDLLAWVVRHPHDVILDIAGAGVLSGLCRELAVGHRNIRFHGSLMPVEALALMARAHVIVGLYYRSSPNHRYAAPNKYFEHLLLARPLLTTRGTPPGDKVVASATGWAIVEGGLALEDWWAQIDWAQARSAAHTAASLWDARYRTYFKDVLIGRYVALVGQLMR